MTLRRWRNGWGISPKRTQDFFHLPSCSRRSENRTWVCLTAWPVSIWSSLASGLKGRSGGGTRQEEGIQLQIGPGIWGGKGWESHEQLRGFTLAWEISGNSDFPRPDYWTTIQAAVIYIPLTVLFTQPAWMQISVWKCGGSEVCSLKGLGDWFYSCSVNTATHDRPHFCSWGSQGECGVPRTLAPSFCLSER